MEVDPDRLSKYPGTGETRETQRESSPEWIGFGSSSKWSGGNPHAAFNSRRASHQSEHRVDITEPNDAFELREENYRLRQYLTQMESNYQQRISELETDNKSLHDEMLKKCETKIMTYKELTEEEIEKYREEANKSRDRLHVLQDIITSGGRQDPEQMSFQEPDERMLSDVADTIMCLIAESDQSMEVIKKNIMITLQKSLIEQVQALSQYRSEIRREFEQKLLRSTRSIYQQQMDSGSSSPLEKILFSPKDDPSQSASTLCAMLTEDLESEKQKSAMVCLKMKESLEKKNNLFEEAVMKKADDLVNGYASQRDEAIQELEKTVDVAVGSTQTDPVQSLSPQQQLVQTVSSEYRRELLASGKPTDASSELACSNPTQFEKEVMQKAQRLLHKYSGVVNMERKSGTEPKPLTGIRNVLFDERSTFTVRKPNIAMYP